MVARWIPCFFCYRPARFEMWLGKIAKTEIVLNDYFLLLLGVYFLLGVLPQALLLFICVAWHEVCHALVAYWTGLPPRSLELFPFGGVARFSVPLAFYPLKEAWIALAGPLGSFGLVLLAWMWGKLTGIEADWFSFFLQANLVLGCFNLLPGLPLDGGRLYRAWRSFQVGAGQATWEGGVLGQFWAVILGLGGLVGFFWGIMDLQSVILALFLFNLAATEKEAWPYLFWRQFWRTRHGNKGEGVLEEVRWLAASADQPLGRIVRRFRPGKHNLVAVLDGQGKICGFVGEKEILHALLEGRWGDPLEKFLR